MKIVIGIWGMGVLALFCTALAFSPETAADHGKEVYAAQKCAMCHSIAGVGGKMKALDGVGSKVKAEDIKKWIKTPKAMKANVIMKAYPNLSEKDLNNLTAYLLTLK